MKDMFVEVTDHWGSTKQKRRVRASPKNPSKITRMNEAVFQWFKLRRSMNLDVDNGQLCDKALMYSQILKVSLHFTASRGWLTRFKERHGISDIKSTHQCKIDSDKVFVSHLKASLRQDNLTPGQVYCVDETVLLWKDPPPSPPDYRFKTDTDKLTLITCTNMDATHKLSLNILGRYPEPLDDVTESIDEVTESIDEVTESIDEVTESIDDVTESIDDVTHHEKSYMEEFETETDVSDPPPNNGLCLPQFCDATTQSTDVLEDAVSAAACTTLKIQSATTTCHVAGQPRDVTAQPPILLYRKGETHELTTDIFTDWFYSTFVPQVKESLAARDLPPKAVLILDNSLYHPYRLSDTEGDITSVKIPCYVANKSLPSATISRSLKARYRIRLAREWLKDNGFCDTLTLRRCFEVLKEEWGEVNEITSTWKHWYQIEHSLPQPDLHLVMLAELLPDISTLLLKQWYMADDRPSEVPFSVPDELQLLDIATQICHTRLTHQLSESPEREEKERSPRSMIELTSEYMEHHHHQQQSPPAYEEAVKQLPNITIPGMTGEGRCNKMQTTSSSGERPEKRQRTEPLMMSQAKPLISLHPQSIIDNILRASLMTSVPGGLTSPTLPVPPFSPLSPTTPDTWPALHALLGITNVKPKVVSKHEALMGLDKFIAYVEQQPDVAGILKDVLYEYRKYALQRL